MSKVFHPRPNPIVAAMYTARDMNVDVIVMHGPAGCSFMASIPLENAGVRVVTSSMKDNDLIFGACRRRFIYSIIIQDPPGSHMLRKALPYKARCAAFC